MVVVVDVVKGGEGFFGSLLSPLLLLWEGKGAHLSVMACHSSLLSVGLSEYDKDAMELIDGCCFSKEEATEEEPTPAEEPLLLFFSANARATILYRLDS